MKEQIIIDARTYFSIDPEMLEKVEDGDLVLVTVNHDEKTAEYIWYPADGNPANFPSEEDDYENVVKDFFS